MTNAVYGDIIPIPGFSEPFSSILHLSAAVVALGASPWLVRLGRGSAGRVAAVCVFVFAAVFLFSMSGVYHLLEPGGAARAVFQRLDHAAIWVLIAGTFTPVHAIVFRGFLRWGVLLIIWSCAITGLVLKTVFFASFPEWLGLVFYLVLGWMGMIGGLRLAARDGFRAVRYMVWGGLSYSAGAVLEFARMPVLIPRVIGPHELFHVGVIGGVALHWLFVRQLLQEHHAARAQEQAQLDALREELLCTHPWGL